MGQLTGEGILPLPIADRADHVHPVAPKGDNAGHDRIQPGVTAGIRAEHREEVGRYEHDGGSKGERRGGARGEDDRRRS